MKEQVVDNDDDHDGDDGDDDTDDDGDVRFCAEEQVTATSLRAPPLISLSYSSP